MVVIICSGLSFTLLVRISSIVLKVEVLNNIELQMTGVLGTKAYRCLDNSKYVLIGLAVIRTTTIALIILDLIKLTAVRRISGQCLSSISKYREILITFSR